MNPKQTLIVIFLIVLLGEAFADLVAANMSYIYGAAGTALFCWMIIKIGQRYAK